MNINTLPKNKKIIVYGDILSGNCYKIKLLLSFLNIEHEWRHVDILNKETHSEDFLQLNPNGKVPVLLMQDGRVLSESNAILYFLAQGTRFIPEDSYRRAKVIEWQCFEQYSHEPFIAVARYIKKYLGLPESRREEYESKKVGGHRALALLDKALEHNDFLVGPSITIADVSLYAYTHVADEGGFNLSPYPYLARWIKRIQQEKYFSSMPKVR